MQKNFECEYKENIYYKNEEQLLSLIAANGSYVLLVKNPTNEMVVLSLLGAEGYNVSHRLRPEVITDLVIQCISEVAEFNVGQAFGVLKNLVPIGLENISEATLVDMLFKNGQLLRGIKEPTLAMQLSACCSNPKIILHINNPSIEVQEAAQRSSKSITIYHREDMHLREFQLARENEGYRILVYDDSIIIRKKGSIVILQKPSEYVRTMFKIVSE